MSISNIHPSYQSDAAKARARQIDKAWEYLKYERLATLLAMQESYELSVAEAHADQNQDDEDFLNVGLHQVEKELRRRSHLLTGSSHADDLAPKEPLDQLKRQVSIVTVIEKLTTTPLVHRNDAVWVSCPFHSDSSPSLKATIESGLWYCFSCHAGGDVFTFAELVTGAYNFAESIRVVCSCAGIDATPYLRQAQASTKPPASIEGFRRHRRTTSPAMDYRNGKLVPR